MRPRALVFDLFGEYFQQTGGAVRLGALSELMGVFGVEPTTVRVAMTRLRKDGWLNSVKSGREVTYVLNERSMRLLEDGRMRIFEREGGEWDRCWTQALVIEAPVPDYARRKRIERALSWWGFGNYGGSAWFSPHDREKKVREMLAGDEQQIQFLRSHSADESSDRFIAERCWDLSDLDGEYHEFIAAYRPRLAGYRRGLPGPDALVESIELIHRYRRYPFRDPDLPGPLLPPGWRGRTAHEVFQECHDTLWPAAQGFVSSVVARY